MPEEIKTASLQNELERFYGEIRDARELLEFAIAEGRPVDDRIVSAVKEAEVSLFADALPAPDKRAAFEKSYRELARFLAPVSVVTLRATSDLQGRSAPFLLGRQKISEAKIWSRKLWAWTLAFILVALCVENLDGLLSRFFPADEELEGSLRGWYMVSSILSTLVPFIYGAIGALTFLLRSCHQHIHKREFDPNRIPEYYNRLLLGIVSGGAIMLFITEIATEEGAVKISAAALAFLAGYNTDFLFTTIERVIAAILPKVGLETVRRAQGAEISAVSLQDLLERYEKAQSEEEKKLLEGLINKLKERL